MNKSTYICSVIKKYTALFFIFLANIIILTHVVLPHHHHNQQVCYERVHCTNDDAIHTQNSTTHKHQHDGTDNSTCVLKQAVIIPSSHDKIIKSCDNCSDNHIHDFFVLSSIGDIDLQPISHTETTVPEFPSFLTSFVTSTLGLRAPPIV